MKVIKRNGQEVDFDLHKITSAIALANRSVDTSLQISEAKIYALAVDIKIKCESYNRAVTVEEIQDLVESNLMKHGAYYIARSYIRYRYDREKARAKNTTDDAIISILDANNEEIKQENSNKDPVIASTQRDYMSGEVSKDLCDRVLLPKHIVKANEEGIIHFHDRDYFAQHIHNCDLLNVDDMLQNGTVINGVLIERPHSFSTAFNIATQATAQVASSQYGGQSISLAHISPFVNETRKQLIERNNSLLKLMDEESFKAWIEEKVDEDIAKGVQIMQYQINTLMTTNGQAPFITVFMNIFEAPEGQERDDLARVIKEVLKQRIQGVKNEKGVYITPSFPKLIYCLDEDNIKPGSKYYDLTRLSAECTAKRMVPDYISAKIMRQEKGDVYTCMGCRSFLTPDRTTENVARALNYVPGKKYYGRFNQGVVTINLVDVALSAIKEDKSDKYTHFWKILDERLKLCYEALMIRHNRLKGTKSDIAPILWQHGALARLDKGETIDKLLYGGYSTISLGYCGLYECTKAMTGYSHTDPRGKDFALDVMRALNDHCKDWKEATNIDFSLYGTPLESTTYKFAKCLQKRFGIIPGITDKNYITNSYHVHVTEEIDAFTKLKFESEFQRLSPGGAISYVEVPNMTNNIDAVMRVIEYIYDNIMYAELNTKSDYCQVCGYDGEIKIINVGDKLVWECPQCKNRDESKMNVARRTCGYIGTHFWNQGRTQEIKDRVTHL